MRKFIALFLVLIFTVTACSCVNKQNLDLPEGTFQAKVLEIRANSLLVEPLEGSTERSSASNIDVSTSGIKLSPLKIGDIIEIVYDGLIAETYPAQISGVIGIKVIK